MTDPARPFAGPDPKFLAIMAWNQRWTERQKSCALAEQAKALSSTDGQQDRATIASALRTLAWQAKWRGDFDTTAQLCMRGKRYASRTSSPYILADLYSLLGVVHYSAGRRDIASNMVKRGFELLDAGAPPETRVDLLVTRSTVLRYRGRLSEARGALASARDLAEGIESARVEHNYARMLNHEGAHAEAAMLGEKALAVAESAQAAVLLPYIYEVLGTSLIALDSLERAVVILEKGLDVARAGHDLRAQCQILNQYGIAAKKLGDIDAATKALSDGIGLATEMGYSLWKRAFAVALGELYETQGAYRDAAEAYKTALELQENIRD
ncbi:hypothetical protein [Tropicimonas sp. S265A]|uniref:hypothetical protein n=1 Tax=Tropicimonas sp. S265A TaxID=3415134 RepID=UPI003C7E8C6E